MVTLRDYCDADYDALKDLWERTGLFFEDNDKRYLLKRKIENSPGSIVLAEDGDEIVGSVAFVSDPWMATIFRLAVREDYREKGLGKGLAVQLIEEAEKRLKERGAESVGVYVKKGRRRGNEETGYRLFGTYDCLEKIL